MPGPCAPCPKVIWAMAIRAARPSCAAPSRPISPARAACAATPSRSSSRRARSMRSISSCASCCRPASEAWIEDPGYPLAREVLAAGGVADAAGARSTRRASTSRPGIAAAPQGARGLRHAVAPVPDRRRAVDGAPAGADRLGKRIAAPGSSRTTTPASSAMAGRPLAALQGLDAARARALCRHAQQGAVSRPALGLRSSCPKRAAARLRRPRAT